MPEIELFVTIGIFFLFFKAGAREIDLSLLTYNFKPRMFLAALIAFAIPFFLTYVFSFYVLSMKIIHSLFLAALISISSLGVVTKVLIDIGKLRHAIGIQIFTISAIVELLGIFIASIILEAIAEYGIFNPVHIATVFLKMAMFFIIAWVAGVNIVPRILRISWERLRAKEIHFGIFIAILFIFVWLAESSGLHGVVGALLFGVILSRISSEPSYANIMRNFEGVSEGIFIPIFFAGIGLSFSFSFFSLPLMTIVGVFSLVVFVRFLSAYAGLKIAKIGDELPTSIALLSKGAVDLALLLPALGLGVVTNEMFSLIIFVVVLTIFIVPLLLQRLLKKDESVIEPSTTIVPLYIKEVFSKARAKDVMSGVKGVIPGDINLKDFSKLHLKSNLGSYIVLRSNGAISGILRPDDMNKIAKGRWASTKTIELCSRDRLVAYPDDSIYSVIEKMSSHHLSILPIVDPKNQKKIYGVVTRADIIKLIATPG